MATTAKLPKTQDLTPAARTALTNAGTSRQGTRVWVTDPATLKELKDLGLIGQGWGLTRAGSIIRDRIQIEDLDRLF